MATRTSKALRRHAKQSRSKVTVDAILEAATHVLVARGYLSATTNRIAERAGVSVGTLYQYFDDKDDVFEALFRRDATMLIELLRAEEIDSSKPLGDTLFRIFDNLLKALPHFPEMLRQLEHAPGALLRRRIEAHEKHLRAVVRQVLEAYRGKLRVDDLDMAAFMIVHASEGIAVSAGGEFSVELLAAELSK